MNRIDLNPQFQINKILLIDDEIAITENLRDFLEDYGYEVELAHNGQEGLDTINETVPDLVIIDLNMPIMNGHDLLNIISKTHPDLPKLVLSGVGVISEAIETVHEGAWDFISKPIRNNNFLLHKLKILEEKATLSLQNRYYREHLEQLVEMKTADIQRLNLQMIDTQKEIVAKLGDVIETRSKETGNHVRQVAQISRLLALAYGLPPEDAETIYMASPLHDIGKIGVPDAILNKPGKLTDDEFNQMKSHTDIGYYMLKDSDQAIIRGGAIIAYQHHERWDGTGYPNGIQGEEIHIYGRITCMADIYDALRQKRIYKPAWSAEETAEYIRDNSGSFFDPKLVDLFVQNRVEVEQIIENFK